MTQAPTHSTVSRRQAKADVLAAVLGYLAARTTEVPYCFLLYEMADQFGADVDETQSDVLMAISALGWAGAVEISTPDGNGFSFGAETTVRASNAIRRYSHFERVPYLDEEEEAA